MRGTNEKRPNILMFLVDEVQSAVTVPGHACRMPNVHAFAGEGVAFTNTFCPSPHCCPSRATIMTGLYPSRHGVYNNVNTVTAFQHGLNPGVRLFSEYLRDTGYRLAYAGKWHVSNEETPADRGWEELTEFRTGEIRPRPDYWDREAPEPEDGPRPRGVMLRPGWTPVPAYGAKIEGPGAYEESRWYPSAVRPGIEALPELARSGQPWALCISTDLDYQNPVPKELADQYAPEEIPLPPSFHDMMADKPRVYARIRQQLWGQLSEEEIRESIAHYWALCSLQDRYFGDILAALEATGQADDTLVLFVGDHGDYCYAHGLANMGVPAFREAYHVPALMRWPRGIAEPGRTVDAFVSLADIAPTLLELAGCPSEEQLTGRSLAPFLRNEETPGDWPDAWYSQTKGNEVYYTQRIVQTKRYKYVCNWFDYDELYDLENDPHEMVNLAFPSEEMQRRTDAERGVGGEGFTPWPHLPSELDKVRQELLGKMWRFARREGDIIFNPFPPVALAAYGPLTGLGR